MLLTAALLAAADFLLVDDVHSYSRVMLQELYRDAGNIDTLFLGSSHCYRSVDPAAVDAAPSVCVVFEDAAAGIEAASRAGMRSVGVGGGASLSAATMRLETFAGFTFEQLAMKIDRD